MQVEQFATEELEGTEVEICRGLVTPSSVRSPVTVRPFSPLASTLVLLNVSLGCTAALKNKEKEKKEKQDKEKIKKKIK